MLRTNHFRLGVRAVYLIFILELLCGAKLEQPHEAEPGTQSLLNKYLVDE